MRVFRHKKTKELFNLSECEDTNTIRLFENNDEYEELFILGGT